MLASLKLEHKIGIVLAVGLALALLMAGVGYVAVLNLRNSSDWTQHTHEVLNGIQQVENNLLDAEIGQRGYLLTGKNAYLSSYQASISRVDGSLANFKQLVADSPIQSKSADTLQQLAKDKMGELKQAIARYDERGLAAAMEVFQQGIDKQWMTDIRREVALIAERENTFSAEHIKAENRAFFLIVFGFNCLILLYAAFVMFSYWLLRDEILKRRELQTKLIDSDARIRAITDHVPALIVYIDRGERYRFCNRFMVEKFGRSQESVLGCTMREVCGKRLYTDVFSYVQRVFSGEQVSFDSTIVQGAQTLHHHSDYIPDIGSDGQVRGFYAISFDVTSRKAVEEAVFQEHERLDVTLRSIGDAVMTTNVDGEINYLNPVAEAMTGWRHQEANGRPINEVLNIINAKSREKVPNPLEQAIRQGCVVELASNSLLIMRDGTEVAIEDSAAPIRDRRGAVIGGVLVFRDVSEMRALALRMGHMAHHDSLTDLPNRALLNDRISQTIAIAKRNQTRFAVLFCDLDRFKQVNDSLGHAAGDALLKQVASRLVSAVRQADTVCRQGGDEFLLLLHDVQGNQSVQQTAEKIGALISAPYSIDGNEVHIGITIGISIFPDDGIAALSLLKNADAAMYRLKNAKRETANLASRGEQDQP